MSCYDITITDISIDDISSCDTDNLFYTFIIMKKEGESFEIEVCPDGDVVAVIGYNVFMTNENGVLDSITSNEENMLPAEDTYKFKMCARVKWIEFIISERI